MIEKRAESKIGPTIDVLRGYNSDTNPTPILAEKTQKIDFCQTKRGYARST